MNYHKMIIEYLELFISWPSVTLAIVLVFQKDIRRTLRELQTRVKSLEFMGQKFDFEVIEKAKLIKFAEEVKSNDRPTWEASLKKANITEDQYQKYRVNIQDRVRYIQEFLQSQGYDLGVAGIDGVFGPSTEKALQQFQRENGLEPDGLMGRGTMRKINALRNKLG